MEQEQQQLEAPLEQQSINSSGLQTGVSKLGSIEPSTGGGTGEDPNEQARHFKMLSDTSIQAQEAARWQTMANNSPQALEGAQIKASAAKKANNDSPQGSQEETGIPVNLQTSIEYMSKVSLREVRVHYDSPLAVEEGVATMHDYPNVYVAPGKKKQLGEELWRIANDLRQKQQVDSSASTPSESIVRSNSSSTPISNSSTPAVENNLLHSEQESTTTEEKKTATNSSGGNLESIVSNPAPEGAEFKGEKPTPITPKPLATPNTDKNFKAVKSAVQSEGDKEQEHESGSHEAKEAERAAVEPANKKSSTAQGQHLGKIEGQQSPAFETNAFVEALMRRVVSIMPKNEKEADEFKTSGIVEELNQAMEEALATAKDKSVGPLEEINKQTPNESGIPTKNVQALPDAPIQTNAKAVQASKSVPAPLRKDRVEQPLQNNSKELDEMMSNNDMTEEQLQKSNEPTFLAALDNKKKAQQDAKDKAVQMRGEEQQQRQQNQQEAEKLGDAQMSAMHQDRSAAMTGVHSSQKETSSNYTAEEKVVADKISNLYQTTKTDVESRLRRLDTRVQQLFDKGATAAQRQFEAYVGSRLRAYKEKRYAGISGKLTWLGEQLNILPKEVNRFFIQGRNLYVRQMERVIQNIAKFFARELNSAKNRVQTGRQEVATYVQSLPDNLRKVGKEAAENINRQFDDLNRKVDAKQDELIETLASKYVQNIKKVDDRIAKLQEENRTLLDVVVGELKGTWEQIQEVKTMLTGALNTAVDAIHAIVLDPIGFLKNLVTGVGQGFSNFLAGIQDNIKTGFVQWLTGNLEESKITMPDDIFSLEGIFSLTTQALGVRWEDIRSRASSILGEGSMAAIEEDFEIFRVIREQGLAGAWEFLKDQFGDLQETIMDSILGMVITEVVEAGIKSILAMLTPAGAFLKAAMMIVDLAQFFINQGSQIIALVNAFTASIGAVIAGNVDQVAKSVEAALKLSIPVLIGFFAAIASVGDLGKKVQKIFGKITKRINKSIDGLIKKAGTWFGGKKGGRKGGRNKGKATKGKNKSGGDGKKSKPDNKKKSKDDDEPEYGGKIKPKATRKKSKPDSNKKTKEDDKPKGKMKPKADGKNSKPDSKKKDKDKKAHQAAVRKGIKLGKAIVNRKDRSEDQIKKKLRTTARKIKLKTLEVKLTKATSEWHTFILTARAGKEQEKTRIKRTPTRADKEAHVTAADRKKHKGIAAKVKKHLEAKGEASEGVETFEAFYKILKSEALKLQKEYQPQLRNGIKIAVDLVNSVQQDKKDGDGDVRIEIAPNNNITEVEIPWKDELKKAQDHFKNNRFSLADLIDILGKSKPTVIKRTNKWKEKNVLFDSGDSTKGYTFDKNSITTIPFDKDLGRAKQHFKKELFTRSELAKILGIEVSTAGSRLRIWREKSVAYHLPACNKHTFDSQKASSSIQKKGTHKSKYVDDKWCAKPSYKKIRDIFYKKNFTKKDKVLKTAVLSGEKNSNGEQLYTCAFSNQKNQQGPKHKEKITESELEIDHEPNVTEHWEKEGRFQTQKERNSWYDDPEHLQVLCLSCNSSKNQGRYNREVGKKFRGPNET